MRRALWLGGLACVFFALVSGACLSQTAEAPTREDARLTELRKELVRLGREQRDSEKSAGQWRARLIELNSRQIDLDKRMEANRASLTRLLSALELYRRNPPPALLVNPRSARDAVQAAILMRATLPELELRRRAYLSEQDELAKIRRAAALASAGLFSAESAAAERQARIETLAAAKRGLETRSGGATKDAAIAASGDVNDLMGKLSEKAAASGAAGLPAAGPLSLERPVVGAVVRHFGERAASGGGDKRLSQGLYWKTAPAASVTAPAAAIIDYAGPIRGLGQVVILNLGGGYRAVVSGLDHLEVETGRSLNAGEPMGRMAPGGPGELELELRRSARPIDPSPWLRAGE